MIMVKTERTKLQGNITRPQLLVEISILNYINVM